MLLAATGGSAALGCSRPASVGGQRAVLPPCTTDTLDAAHAVRSTLDRGACPAPNGDAYVDAVTQLAGGQAYLVRALDLPDTIGGSRHRRFDATLLSPADSGAPRVLLRGTPFEERDPNHTISQLFFIAPATGTYLVRVRGHEPRDRGPFALTEQHCGGGTLALGRTSDSSLGAGSCLEEMSFGADSGYADLWRLHLDADQRVAISLFDDGRGPFYLRLAGPGLRGGEAAGDVNRLRFTPRRGGDYTLLVGELGFHAAPRAYAVRATLVP